MQAKELVSVSGLRLRSFQVELVDDQTPQPFSIVADDMGLGKTVEGIALDLMRRYHAAEKVLPIGPYRTLVLCPLSVLDVWREHYAEWAPSLRVKVIDRKKRDDFEEAVKAGNYDVYVAHWPVIRLLPELAKHKWFHIIADEAHAIGNKDSQVTIRTKRIKWHYLTELTGTPMTARPEQFWSLLNWGKPVRFSSFHRFFNQHVIYQRHDKSGDCQAIVNGAQCGKQHQNAFTVIMGIANEDKLLQEIKPYYWRRLKEEVLEDLPDKYFTTIKVDLDPKQRKVYNQMRDQMLAWVGDNEEKPMAAGQAITKLVRLQQLACAYADMYVENRKKRHVHSDNCQQTGKHCTQIWDEVEEIKVKLVEPSSKLDAVMEILDANPDKQFVVFSQSKQVINLLGRRLGRASIRHGILTGDTSQPDRGDLVRAFQAGRLRVFAGTIKAGGEGITLTAASTVIFLDRSWSPAKNKQAEDRLHRMGQKSAVQVIDIVARNTVDLGRLQRLENNWYFIKKLLGDHDAVAPKPEGAYV